MDNRAVEKAFWQKPVAWAFSIGAAVSLIFAAGFLLTPNPSGDFITGMGALFAAILAAGGAAVLAMMAVIAWAFHTRAAKIAGAILVFALGVGFVLIQLSV